MQSTSHYKTNQAPPYTNNSHYAMEQQVVPFQLYPTSKCEEIQSKILSTLKGTSQYGKSIHTVQISARDCMINDAVRIALQLKGCFQNGLHQMTDLRLLDPMQSESYIDESVFKHKFGYQRAHKMTAEEKFAYLLQMSPSSGKEIGPVTEIVITLSKERLDTTDISYQRPSVPIKESHLIKDRKMFDKKQYPKPSAAGNGYTKPYKTTYQDRKQKENNCKTAVGSSLSSVPQGYFDIQSSKAPNYKHKKTSNPYGLDASLQAAIFKDFDDDEEVHKQNNGFQQVEKKVETQFTMPQIHETDDEFTIVRQIMK